MTQTVDPARAAEILTAYGADPARWPADERSGVAALLATDAVLQVLRDDAAELDALLGGWATAPLADTPSAPLPQIAPARHWPRLMAGGIAAAVVALTFLQPGNAPVPVTQTAQQVAPPITSTAKAPISEAPTYAMLFTLTPDEESLI